MERRIDKDARANLHPEVLALLENSEQLRVSGQPLMVSPADTSQPLRFFAECAPLEDEVVKVSYVRLGKIPVVGHRELPDAFLSNEGYPVVHCYDMGGNEVVLGVREALGFRAQPY